MIGLQNNNTMLQAENTLLIKGTVKDICEKTFSLHIIPIFSLNIKYFLEQVLQ